MMAGYPIGQISSGQKIGPIAKIFVLVVAALICIATAILYVIRVQMGQSDTSDIVILALLIFGFFFSFAFLMPFGGVIVDRSGA